MTKDKQRSIPFGYKLIAGILSLLAMFAVAMAYGAADTTLRDVWLSLVSDAAGEKLSVIRDIRLPRMVITLLAGMALALSGAVLQGITRNDLADPGIVGINAGAGVAIAVFFLFFPVKADTFVFALPFVAFVGALLTAVALAASAVSVTGGIAFIGLMAPHMAKALVGPRHHVLIPVSVLLGGWLLLLADTTGRHLHDPDGIPAGIMAALLGAPYFLYLLLKS
ncbi:iron ABC transporter permease [Brevibacillus sp. WF146]|uniref:FecCD family ABC transporter permease n=1 Tax=Brevibacillus sp. WF146 TaxID=319501 RepID=UPI0007ED4982|nr:iron ABC transporter permease [Brevibacillus sp. WF146]UYZ14956.1 iron ABC transporter permease [Brevibacillus sp. WF146]